MPSYVEGPPAASRQMTRSPTQQNCLAELMRLDVVMSVWMSTPSEYCFQVFTCWESMVLTEPCISEYHTSCA